MIQRRIHRKMTACRTYVNCIPQSTVTKCTSRQHPLSQGRESHCLKSPSRHKQTDKQKSWKLSWSQGSNVKLCRSIHVEPTIVTSTLYNTHLRSSEKSDSWEAWTGCRPLSALPITRSSPETGRACLHHVTEGNV